MSTPDRVLRIFLSSTAIDLTAYREKARDAIATLGNLPVAMETFTALPNTPVSECRAMAATADATVVIVAHRYGYVPPVEFGGDGEKSITWLEVEAAYAAGKPVLAFLVDPQTPWTEVKEQDRLVTEPDKAGEIIANVQRLQEFKKYLQSRSTPAAFTTADDLKAEVTAALARFGREAAPAAAPRQHEWRPLVMHPLQPAQHFSGREVLRADLIRWMKFPVTPDRVVSLVAVGGTGKTALVERVLRDLGRDPPAGVLVWSFYEDPRTDEFLRVACEYFTGEIDTPPGGRLERLQRALAGSEAHLLVLDGLERVQAEGHDGRPRGTLEDPQLKRLVRYLAGGPGRARALVTSRFPLVDLDDWKGAGHRTERLDDLDPPAARAVLRGWGVQGDNATLNALVEPLHGHALSVAVLGSFLGNYHAGDPSRAPAFDRGEAAADDPKAAKLGRILGEYAQALSEPERDLLARLAAFPRGVRVAVLAYLVDAGGEVAGTLIGWSEARLVQLLERLRGLGLVFGYRAGHEVTYTAHPFLRSYFKELLDVPAENVHEVVRSRLAPSLEARPATPPTETSILDRYEALVEHTRLAGRTLEAFDLYWYGMGSNNHLGELGECARGLRILTAFSADNDPTTAAPDLPESERGALINDWGNSALEQGDIYTARRAFEFVLPIALCLGQEDDAVTALQNRSYVELLAGRLPAAKAAAEEAHAYALLTGNSKRQSSTYAQVATMLAHLGDMAEATRRYQIATELNGRQLYSVQGLYEAEFLYLTGDIAGARQQTVANIELCRDYGWHLTLARCETLLGRLMLPGDPAAARVQLDAAREFGSRSSVIEVQLRAYTLAAELAQRVSDLPTATAEAEAGILLADGCGSGRFGIDLRLILARVHLEAGDARAALRRAREALDRSAAPECQYAWGEAGALDLAGRGHARLGEPELARQRLAAAVALRERLTHPGLEDSRRALAALG